MTTNDTATNTGADTTAANTGATSTAEQVRAVLHQLADVLDGIRDDQASDPTPCTEFDVTDLREHIVGWSSAFAAGFADSGGQAPEASATAVEGTGAAQVRAAGDRLVEGIAGGGAERPFTLADGNAMPGDMALAMTLWEYQVHGWDLATATGQPWSPDEAPVEDSIAFAEPMLTPDFQGEGKAFAPRFEIADDAPAIDRLVALSGRDPRWTGADTVS
ncbi:MAG: TIGR03086 family metal-binding protein [Tetrasphaera sp.]